jgi:hypothetical protein
VPGGVQGRETASKVQAMLRKRAFPLAGAVLAATALAIAGCGEKEEPPITAPEQAEQPGAADGVAEPGPGPGGATADPDAAAARQAERAYRRYIEAITERDGATLCGLLAPGWRQELQPPRERDGCAPTLRASIGYADPRGFPVWEATRLTRIERIQVDGSRARLTGAVVTRFADRQEPSVESDIAYLERAAGDWRLAKPSGALYRAVGKPEVPPRALTPP